MRIVFVNNSDETFTPTHSGAIATWIWECCRAAARAGDRPLVISRSSAHKPYSDVEAVFADYPRLPRTRLGTMAFRLQRRLNGWRHLRQKAYARRVARMIDGLGLGPIALFCQNDPEMAILLRQTFPRVRVVHHFQNQLEVKPVFRHRLAGSGVVVSAVSDFTARWLETYYHLPPRTVRTIYSGVDSARFRPDPAPANLVPVIGFVGRTGIEKAPDLLLRAAVELARRGRRFALQILGANHWGRLEIDDYQRQLQALVDDLKSAGIEVRCPGHIDRVQLPAEVRKADIHVVPSRWDEPFGLVTLEGMSSGCATVASATGGTPEVVGDAGLLFDRDSVEQLTDHLDRLIADPQFRTGMAARARARATTFTWDQTWRHVREVCSVRPVQRSSVNSPAASPIAVAAS